MHAVIKSPRKQQTRDVPDHLKGATIRQMPDRGSKETQHTLITTPPSTDTYLVEPTSLKPVSVVVCVGATGVVQRAGFANFKHILP